LTNQQRQAAATLCITSLAVSAPRIQAHCHIAFCAPAPDCHPAAWILTLAGIGSRIYKLFKFGSCKPSQDAATVRNPDELQAGKVEVMLTQVVDTGMKKQPQDIYAAPVAPTDDAASKKLPEGKKVGLFDPPLWGWGTNHKQPSLMTAQLVTAAAQHAGCQTQPATCTTPGKCAQIDAFVGSACRKQTFS
jgi:hypothetical protein